MEWNTGSCSVCAFVRVFACTRERRRVQERGQLEMLCFTWSGSALGANYAVILQLEQVIFSSLLRLRKTGSTVSGSNKCSTVLSDQKQPGDRWQSARVCVNEHVCVQEEPGVHLQVPFVAISVMYRWQSVCG